MPRSCVAYGCLNSACVRPELSYFKLPSNLARRSHWLRLISREDLMNRPSQNYTVCEEHFNAMDILAGTHRRKLKTNSLPSLHLPDLHKKEVATLTEAPKLIETWTQTEENIALLACGSTLTSRSLSFYKKEPVGSAEDDAATTQDKSPDVEYIQIEGTPNSDPLENIKPEDPTNDSYHVRELNPPIPPPSSTGRQSANVMQHLESTVSNDGNSTPNRQEVSLQGEDEFHMFALSVAAQLRQLPLHVAITTQSKIQSMLSEARLASLFSNSNSTQLLIGMVKTEETSDD